MRLSCGRSARPAWSRDSALPHGQAGNGYSCRPGQKPSRESNAEMHARAMAVVTNFIQKFTNDWSMNLVSMIAYNLIAAIFPILLALLSIVGMVLRVFASSTLDNFAGFISSAFPETRQGGITIT